MIDNKEILRDLAISLIQCDGYKLIEQEVEELMEQALNEKDDNKMLKLVERYRAIKDFKDKLSNYSLTQ